MHQCHDALLWCITIVMHYRYNASTLWWIKYIMCQRDLYVLTVCVEMQCDEWVMHSMMQCVMNGWCMGDALVVWCVMWMNEWMDELFNGE